MSNEDALAAVVRALRTSSLIPDIIPESENFTPSILFSVVYPNKPEQIIAGTESTRDEMLQEPEFTFTPMMRPDERSRKGEVTYTMVMTDPDAPSRADPQYMEYRHWLITGLKSPDGQFAATNFKPIKTKPSTTNYYAPNPHPGTGVHRYAFLLFEEPASGYSIPAGAIEHSSERPDRRKWNSMKFARQYGLKLVGATFFSVSGAPAE